jgi:hypothetical protein
MFDKLEYFHLIINTLLELLDSSPIAYYLKHELSSEKLKTSSVLSSKVSV